MKTFMKGYLKIMNKELWFDLTRIEGKKKDYISYIVSMEKMKYQKKLVKEIILLPLEIWKN